MHNLYLILEWYTPLEAPISQKYLCQKKVHYPCRSPHQTYFCQKTVHYPSRSPISDILPKNGTAAYGSPHFAKKRYSTPISQKFYGVFCHKTVLCRYRGTPQEIKIKTALSNVILVLFYRLVVLVARLPYTIVCITPTPGAVFRARLLDNQEGANTERYVFGKLSGGRCF